LLTFYKADKVTVTGLANLIKELNFFVSRGKNSQEISMESDSSVSIITKLEFDSKVENVQPELPEGESER
jgi:hypothetical protein